jgi:hypothetical protein
MRGLGPDGGNGVPFGKHCAEGPKARIIWVFCVESWNIPLGQLPSLKTLHKSTNHSYNIEEAYEILAPVWAPHFLNTSSLTNRLYIAAMQQMTRFFHAGNVGQLVIWLYVLLWSKKLCLLVFNANKHSLLSITKKHYHLILRSQPNFISLVEKSHLWI